jgi:hypothetical protein
MKKFKELMMDINEKLSPDQKKAFLKKKKKDRAAGRIHEPSKSHLDDPDDIDNAAKNNSKDELKKKMKNASDKGDHKKERKYNRALRKKSSHKEPTYHLDHPDD